VIAPSLKDAAQYYPAIYWAAMIKCRTAANSGHRAEWQRHPDDLQDLRSISQLREDQRLRQLPPDRQLRDPHDSGSARQVRLVDGRLGAAPAVGPGWHHHDQQYRAVDDARRRHLAALAEWTDRVKAGELPSATPARPLGVERNLVVTVRDWSDPKHYLHDLIATDRRDPTVNGYG
jgi:hypothetical protein